MSEALKVCGEWCFGWKETQLHCALPAGHKGAHKLSASDDVLADRALADFMHRAVSRPTRAAALPPAVGSE